jgi:hypothetical protein
MRSVTWRATLRLPLPYRGLGWLLYLYPPFAYRMFPVVATAAALAEFPLELWLIVAGVNPERWKEQASTAVYEASTLASK